MDERDTNEPKQPVEAEQKQVLADRRDFLKSISVVVAATAAGGAHSNAEAQPTPTPPTGPTPKQPPQPPLPTGVQKYIASRDVNDLRQVRLPTTKPFEQLTIGELVQLRPAGGQADSYNVEAVGSDVSISSSSMLANIARVRAAESVRHVQQSSRDLGAKVRVQTDIRLK